MSWKYLSPRREERNFFFQIIQCMFDVWRAGGQKPKFQKYLDTSLL